MKIIITVKGTDNIIGLKEDIAMRLEGIADILRIDTIDVTPNSDVAREIFEEIEKIIQSAYYVDELGEWHDETLLLGGIDELKKKYAEGSNE